MRRIVFLLSLTVVAYIVGYGCGGGSSAPTTPNQIPISVDGISIDGLDGQEDVGVDSSFKYTFGKAVDSSTVTGITYYIEETALSSEDRCNVANALSSSVDCTSDTECLLTPSSNLDEGTNYTICLTPGSTVESNISLMSLLPTITRIGIYYADGEPFEGKIGDDAVDFITEGTAAITIPTASNLSPANGATEVAINTNVIVTFNEEIDTNNITIDESTFTLVDGDNNPVDSTVSVSANTATLNPNSDLSYETIYTASLSIIINSDITAVQSWSFTTSDTPDTTNPTIISRSPASFATDIATNTTVTVTFSEEMDSSTITNSTLTVTPTAGGGAESATVLYDTSSLVATLTLTGELENSTQYTISCTASDVAGNEVSETWTFTTVDPDGGELWINFSIDGKLSQDFGVGSDYANDVVVQSDGKIVVGGYARNASDDNDFAIARYNENGSLDTNFSDDGLLTIDITVGEDDQINALVLKDDGTIVACGTTYNRTDLDIAIAVIDTNGDLDPSFSGDGIDTYNVRHVSGDNDYARACAVHSSGDYADDIVVGLTAGTRAHIIRFDSTGGVAATHVGSTAEIYAIAINGDDNYVVGGAKFNADYDFYVAVIDSGDGSFVNSWSGDGVQTTDFGSGNDMIFDLTIQPNGMVVVTGRYNDGTNDQLAIARYNTAGVLDVALDDDGKITESFASLGYSASESYGIVIDSVGDIIVVGNASEGADRVFSVVKYDSAGNLDLGFGSNGKVLETTAADNADFFNKVAVRSDDKIVAAGYAHEGGSINDFVIMIFWP